MTARGEEPHRWIAVAPSWLGHRPEPLIHERVWACPLVLGDDAGATRWAGVDGDGRFVAMRDHEYVEHVAFEPDAIVVSTGEREVVRTELDDHGRPVRSVYRRGEERYGYDGDGRLVEIVESEALAGTADGERMETGGHLSVEHDARGPRAIRGEDETIWERIDEPWPAVLARGAREIADGLIEAVAGCDPAPGTEVFALSLTYVNQGSLHTVLSFGLERDRREWLAEDLDEEELASNLWYLIANGEGLKEIERYDIPQEFDELLLREAALKQPGDPYRAVLHAVAALLARHDWAGLVEPTEDFVVFIAEHDEGVAPKHESVRAVNPPERIAAWDARWPAGVPRDDTWS